MFQQSRTERHEGVDHRRPARGKPEGPAFVFAVGIELLAGTRAEKCDNGPISMRPVPSLKSLRRLRRALLAVVQEIDQLPGIQAARRRQRNESESARLLTLIENAGVLHVDVWRGSATELRTRLLLLGAALGEVPPANRLGQALTIAMSVYLSLIHI